MLGSYYSMLSAAAVMLLLLLLPTTDAQLSQQHNACSDGICVTLDFYANCSMVCISESAWSERGRCATIDGPQLVA
jgi:hypothetical protein